MSKNHHKKNKVSSSTLYPHKCIKCKIAYSDADMDDYLCEECNASRLAIAREIDQKFNTVGQQPNSDLTNYDAICKAQGGKWPVMRSDGSLAFIPTSR